MNMKRGERYEPTMCFDVCMSFSMHTLHSVKSQKNTVHKRNSEAYINIYMLITKLQFNGLPGKDLAQIINKPL